HHALVAGNLSRAKPARRFARASRRSTMLRRLFVRLDQSPQILGGTVLRACSLLHGAHLFHTTAIPARHADQQHTAHCTRLATYGLPENPLSNDTPRGAAMTSD